MTKWRCDYLERIWSLAGQYDSWLEVEKAVALAQGQTGDIPLAAAIHIDLFASYSLDRCLELEKEMRHDLNAFVRCVAESIKHPLDYGSLIHYGLTSSDVVDTALSLRLTRTGSHLHDLCSYKTVYPWSQAQRLLARATREIEYGKISGPVGTHASVSPNVEVLVMRRLGLLPEPVSTQIVPRDRHAAYVVALAGVALAFGGRETAAVLIALENIPLWHERDISHSGNERIYLPEICLNVDRLLHKAKGDF